MCVCVCVCVGGGGGWGEWQNRAVLQSLQTFFR